MIARVMSSCRSGERAAVRATRGGGVAVSSMVVMRRTSAATRDSRHRAVAHVIDRSLDRLELLERLPAGVAEVDRLAARRAERAAQLGLRGTAVGAGDRLAAAAQRDELLVRRRRAAR